MYTHFIEQKYKTLKKTNQVKVDGSGWEWVRVGGSWWKWMEIGRSKWEGVGVGGSGWEWVERGETQRNLINAQLIKRKQSLIRFISTVALIHDWLETTVKGQ